VLFRSGGEKKAGPIRCITVGHWLRDWEAVGAAAEIFAAEGGVEFHLVTGGDTGLSHLPNVTQHKGLSDAELVALYQSCDIGFLPLIDSTANNSLLEMIACGLPLLSTDIVSVRAYMGTGNSAILLPKGERNGFADVIRELARDKDRRSALGAAARQRAVELSWKNIAPRYADLYGRLLGRPQ
jgi:glycosyltransferase involved in cell wall biosynthesis